MKYVITGSLGHISRPVVSALVAAGHQVSVVSSQEKKAAEITAIGAVPLIGSITDEAFVNDAFIDADAVYLMIPPNFAVADFPAYQRVVANNYVSALRSSQAKNIVLLSSIGAHLREGAGPIDELGNLEERLKGFEGKNIQVLRPAFFYYNLLGMAGMLKTAGVIGSNFGNDTEPVALAHHLDIANQVTGKLLHPSADDYSITYVVSDERLAADIATVLGNAVGKNDVPWITFSDEQSYEAMTRQGFTPSLASEYVEMGKAFREGKLQADYFANRSATTSGRKLEEFAKEFALVYASIPEHAELNS